jgi:hypothetical protein
MFTRKILLPLCSALALGATIGGAANAYGSSNSAVVSAKFNCGTASVDGDVVQGVYATSINIHNPQQSSAVQFGKTIVQAFEEGTTSSGSSFQTTDTLQPNQAEFVDCAVIYRSLKITPGTPIEGFVELNILNSSYGSVSLDVVGKYTARPAGGQVSALSIVVYTLSQGH